MAKTIKKHSKAALIIGLTIVLLVTYGAIPQGVAGTILGREVRLSDSRPSPQTSTYDFNGDYPAASGAKCIQVQFCTTAAGTCTPAGMGISAATKGTEGDWAGWTYADWDFATNDTDDIIAYTYATGEVPSPSSDASFSVNTITNPGTGVKYARIQTRDATTDCSTTAPGGDQIDSGTVAFAIISGVAVSVTVSETLSSSVYGVAPAQCPNYDNGGSPNEVSTDADAVAFGTVNTEAFYDGCQDVRVATNALNYTTRVYKTAALTCTNSLLCDSSTISDGTCNGGCSTTTEADWTPATYNGFGYCMDDESGYGDGAETADSGWADGANSCDAADTFFKLTGTASANAQAIMNSTAAAVSDDRAYIGYRISVDTAQAAGPYSTTIVYTTTPTY